MLSTRKACQIVVQTFIIFIVQHGIQVFLSNVTMVRPQSTMLQRAAFQFNFAVRKSQFSQKHCLQQHITSRYRMVRTHTFYSLLG